MTRFPCSPRPRKRGSAPGVATPSLLGSSPTNHQSPFTFHLSHVPPTPGDHESSPAPVASEPSPARSGATVRRRTGVEAAPYRTDVRIFLGSVWFQIKSVNGGTGWINWPIANFPTGMMSFGDRIFISAANHSLQFATSSLDGTRSPPAAVFPGKQRQTAAHIYRRSETILIDI